MRVRMSRGAACSFCGVVAIGTFTASVDSLAISKSGGSGVSSVVASIRDGLRTRGLGGRLWHTCVMFVHAFGCVASCNVSSLPVVSDNLSVVAHWGEARL